MNDQESRREAFRPRLFLRYILVEKWQDYLSEGNSMANAILDRLVSGAIRIILRGESMRKLRTQGELGQVEDEPNPALARSGGEFSSECLAGFSIYEL